MLKNYWYAFFLASIFLDTDEIWPSEVSMAGASVARERERDIASVSFGQ